MSNESKCLTNSEVIEAINSILEPSITKYTRADSFIEGVRFAERHHGILWWKKMSMSKIRAAIINGPRETEGLNHINDFSRAGAFGEGVSTAERYHKI